MSNKSPIRTSNQRHLIYDFLTSTLTHPTADQVFQAVRKKLPRISIGTVYRNLDILEKQGSIEGLNYSKEHVRYHIAEDSHYHFVCTKCDKVENIVLEELIDLNQQVAKRHELNIKKHSLYFYGLCSDCSKLK
jgi:Fur family transcriptional regulator, peroxide stress response regulator